MNKHYEILDLKYAYGNQEQHIFPTVLFGKNDMILVDCGYPGSLAMIEEQLCAHGMEPAAITKLLLTHQDDDHMGAAAELKKKYPDIQILASSIEAPYISGRRKNLRLQQGEELQKQLPDDQKVFGKQQSWLRKKCGRFPHGQDRRTAETGNADGQDRFPG